MNRLRTTLHSLAKRLQFRTPLRRGMLHRYDYFFWPEELAFLCQNVSAAVKCPGNIVEIGCANGATSVFLNKHLDFLTKKTPELVAAKDLVYYCIDTFSGFTAEDVRHEVSERGKHRDDYFAYALNDIDWFRAMLNLNGVSRAKAIQTDANSFDFSQLGSLSFCLVDVDLYRPVKASLEAVYPLVSPGGIILVDDCKPNSKWDGALQAYQEFVEEHSLKEEIHYGKFGVIRLPGGES